MTNTSLHLYSKQCRWVCIYSIFNPHLGFDNFPYMILNLFIFFSQHPNLFFRKNKESEVKENEDGCASCVYPDQFLGSVSATARDCNKWKWTHTAVWDTVALEMFICCSKHEHTSWTGIDHVAKCLATPYITGPLDVDVHVDCPPIWASSGPNWPSCDMWSDNWWWLSALSVTSHINSLFPLQHIGPLAHDPRRSISQLLMPRLFLHLSFTGFVFYFIFLPLQMEETPFYSPFITFPILYGRNFVFIKMKVKVDKKTYLVYRRW